MPKDYRERRIDEKPPKLLTRNARQAATTTDPGSGGLGTGSTVDLETGLVTISPGDGVLWFMSQPTADTAPSGRGVELQTTEGGAVTFDYVSSPSGWSDYLTSFAGTYTLGVDGITVVTDETVYVMWDQFYGFTAGNYKLHFTHTGSIDKALLLRNVSTSAPGAFYAGMSQSPTWSKTFVSNETADITNNFPRTLSLGGAGTARSAFAIYQMSGTVEAPAALYSAPGVTLLTYTFTDPTDPPAFNRTIVTFYGDTLPTTTTLSVAAPWENGWGGAA